MKLSGFYVTNISYQLYYHFGVDYMRLGLVILFWNLI